MKILFYNIPDPTLECDSLCKALPIGGIEFCQRRALQPAELDYNKFIGKTAFPNPYWNKLEIVSAQ